MNKNKIKIAYLAPIRKGGPYNVLKSLSEELNENENYETKFYASIKGLITGMISNKYDIIHTALPLPINLFKKKIIFHIHGDYRIEKGLNNPLGYLYPNSIKKSNHIIVPSNFLKEKLNLNNANVIANPIKKPLQIKKNYSLKNKNKIKLFIATKFHFKEKAEGIIDLIKILNEIKTNKIIELDVYGDGKYKNEIKIQSNKIKNKNIKINFKGFTKTLFKNSINYDIFTYHSNLDTFGVALLEMQSMGMPIITNEFGAAKEIIKDNESGFIGKNDKDYINKLQNLINNKEIRKSIGIKGKKSASKYLINNIINKFQKLYEK